MGTKNDRYLDQGKNVALVPSVKEKPKQFSYSYFMIKIFQHNMDQSMVSLAPSCNILSATQRSRFTVLSNGVINFNVLTRLVLLKRNYLVVRAFRIL